MVLKAYSQFLGKSVPGFVEPERHLFSLCRFIFSSSGYDSGDDGAHTEWTPGTTRLSSIVTEGERTQWRPATRSSIVTEGERTQWRPATRSSIVPEGEHTQWRPGTTILSSSSIITDTSATTLTSKITNPHSELVGLLYGGHELQESDTRPPSQEENVDNGRTGRATLAYRRIPLFRKYEIKVAKKIKSPGAPRVRPSYTANIRQQRNLSGISPPEEDRILILMYQVGSSVPKPNIHCLATSEIQIQNIHGRSRGGAGKETRYKESKKVTTVVSINAPKPLPIEIKKVSGIIKSLPFYHDLVEIWQGDDGQHSNFIAQEYIKHSRWSTYERLSISDYCYTAMRVTEAFLSEVKDFQQLLPLLNFFEGHVYECSHLEYILSYVVGVKVKGYYESIPDDKKVKGNKPEHDSSSTMVKLKELNLASSTKGVLVDHPKEYTTGLFLL
ncbi:hypothetical protein POM88_015896 [Heracleum sosnowskyi]|uniref:Uncharacterized protein n=1 Tax=Heracleum sosnowskyi TaxID=360622 RepID=A0AAD8IMZ7_9APIA|nr:hypothetical protein POM88_015896 [Heracleum sosnowskyi]